jgi:hypothetical protein
MKKIIAIIITFGLLAPHTLVLATAIDLSNTGSGDQLFWPEAQSSDDLVWGNVEGDVAANLVTPDIYTGSNINYTASDQPFDSNITYPSETDSGQRTQKDQQSQQQAAKAHEAQQKKDEEECNKQGGGAMASDAIGQAVQPMMEEAVKKTMEESVKKAVPAVLKKGVQETVPKIIKSSIQTELPKVIKSKLPTNLQSRLIKEKAVGTDLSNKTIVSGIVQDEMKKVISGNLPNILSQSLNKNLPGALGQYLQSNLSNTISQNITTNLPNNIMGNLEETLSNSNLGDQIDTALRDALDQSEAALSEELISSIGTDALNDITEQLTSSLNDNMDKITSTLTGSLDGMVNDLTSSLMDPITGMMDNLTSSLMDPITGMMDNLTSSLMDPITGMMDNLTSSLMDPITGMMDNLTSSLMDPITGMMDNITGSITDTIGQTIGDTVGQTVGQTVGDTVGSAVTSNLGGAVGGVFGGVVGGALGLGFVPVKEQNGPLLKTTKSIDGTTKKIDKTTDEIKKLTVEICKHTKSIKRIQQSFEKKEFSNDPTARAEARDALAKYNEGLDKYLKEAYEVDGSGAKGPLYVTNIADHIAKQEKEQKQIMVEAVKNSGNNDAEAINKAITEELSQPDIEMLKSDLPKNMRDKLMNDPAGMSATDGWSAFIKAAEPQNNFRGSLILAADILGQRQNQAAGLALSEYEAGNGYLPTRTCTEKVGNTCFKWETGTPASANKVVADNWIATRQNQYLQAKNKDEVTAGNEPQVSEIADFKPSASGGGWSSGVGSGNSGGGSNSGGFDLSSIFSLLQSQTNGGGVSNILNLLSQFNTNKEPKPAVSINLNKTNASLAKLQWSTTDVKSCKANNDWYSLGTNNEIQIVKSAGESLGAGSNSLDIKIPIPASAVKLTVRQNAFIYDIGTTVITSTNGLTKETSFSLANDPTYKPQPTDIYTLKVGDQAVSYTNNTNDVSIGINGLKAAVEALDPSSVTSKKFSQIKFNFIASSGKITAAMNVNYKIICVGKDDNESVVEAETNK